MHWQFIRWSWVITSRKVNGRWFIFRDVPISVVMEYASWPENEPPVPTLDPYIVGAKEEIRTRLNRCRREEDIIRKCSIMLHGDA